MTEGARPLALLAAAAVLSACEGPVPTSIQTNTAVVTLDAVGATAQLNGNVLDQNGELMEDSVPSWSSSNVAVATVSPSGLVTAVANGTATVSATSGPVREDVSVTVSQVPAALAKASGDNQAAEVGVALELPIAVRVEDRLGAPIAGISVTFAVTAGGGSLATSNGTTDASGEASTQWTLGTVSGSHAASATRGQQTVTFNAAGRAGPADTLAAVAGDGQTRDATLALPESLVVRVVDRFGNPVPVHMVQFAVTSGGGSVSPTSGLTGANGRFATRWTLGPDVGPQTVDATTAGVSVGSPTTFTATATPAPPYNVELRYLTSLSVNQEAAFDTARTRWSRIITTDVPDVHVTRSAGTCGTNSPAIDEDVDDLLILVFVEPIDGAGGVLGQAGFCDRRSGSLHPALGLMRFDDADLNSLESSGLLEEVILHEMAHVIGFGRTNWTDLGLLQDPSLSGGMDPHFNGPEAIAAFDAVGGTTYMGGNKVPVENTGGQGTADSHWRETVFQSELMTGFINAGINPLSVVTIEALEDMGYAVDPGEADVYVLALSLLASAGTRIELRDDFVDVEVHDVDRSGRVVRVLYPGRR